MEAIVSRITRGAALDEIRIITDRRPITTNNVNSQQFDPATIQQDSEATRIIIHERFPQLVVDFLNHKRQYGSQVERAFYNDPEWTWQLQVARLGMYIRFEMTFLLQNPRFNHRETHHSLLAFQEIMINLC